MRYHGSALPSMAMANLGSSFDDIFGVAARAPKAPPVLPQDVAASCLRCAIAVLAADSRVIQRSLAEALAGSSIKTAPDGDLEFPHFRGHPS